MNYIDLTSNPKRTKQSKEDWMVSHFDMQNMDVIDTGNLISRGRYADYTKQRCLSAVLDHIDYW